MSFKYPTCLCVKALNNLRGVSEQADDTVFMQGVHKSTAISDDTV